uniref:Uncharacterized protein n=1 Tax=Daphnia magna TaxID=35525 RepID=A0A0P6I6A3_9CRUS
MIVGYLILLISMKNRGGQSENDEELFNSSFHSFTRFSRLLVFVLEFIIAVSFLDFFLIQFTVIWQSEMNLNKLLPWSCQCWRSMGSALSR